MKKKIIVSISIIFVLLLAVVLGVKIDYVIKLSQIEYREIELNDKNCEYSINEEQKTVEIKEYKGIEDCIVVPQQINGYTVENVDIESFSECYNLETIKLPKKVAENIGEIPDFEISENEEKGDYVTYTTTREYSEIFESYLNLSLKEKNKIQIIPNKFDVPMTKMYSAKTAELYGTNLAALEVTETSYDLRNDIKIEVEDQKTFGNCFAYASLSSIETNIALTRDEIVDFSEIHASVMTTGYGGTFFTADHEYYANKIGPVYEEDLSMEDVYGNNENTTYQLMNTYLKGEDTLTQEEIQEIKEYASQKKAVEYVTETFRFRTITPSMKKDSAYAEVIEETRNQIKQHIKNYGSVAASVAISGATYYAGNTVLCDTTSTVYDHSVSIVGWDDEFSNQYFPSTCRPETNGAYLVLNSYGDGWGNGGYFWVSYEDALIESNLCGVVSVEDISENIDSTSMIVTDVDTNTVIHNSDVRQGQNIKIETTVTVNSLTAGNEIEVTLRDSNDNIDSNMSITGNQIVDNQANIVINISTGELKGGKYILEFSYGEETISKSLTINGDYKYVLNIDGTITITQYSGTDTVVVVPSEYEGYKISAIGDYAFANNGSITSLTLSKGITTIGVNAFYQCTGLKTISLPEGITTIGQLAFFNCASLSSITLPSTVTTLGEYAFQQCYNLKTVNLSESLISIERGTFFECTALTSITIPKNVTYIGKGAFQKCSSLTFIKIPRTVSYLDEDIFHNCSKLKTVVIFKETTTIAGKDMFYNCYSVTIYGEENSAAQTFAQAGNYRFQVLKTYTVSYNGNISYGTVKDVPEAQIKTQYDDLLISEKIPYRYGFIFKGWADNATATSAQYQPGGYYTKESDMTLYAVWEDDPNIDRIDVGAYYFEDATYVYDGTEKTIISEGHNDDIVDITYNIEPIGNTTLKNGKAVEVGQYKLTATYELKGDQIFTNGINTKTAILTITKATYNMSGITFVDAEYTYDKTQKNIYINGELPEGVTVSYENNGVVNAGEYTVIAKFSIADTKNYESINPMSAVLKINKATIDMSEIKFTNKEVTYNGEEQFLLVTGTLPKDVEVTYSNNYGVEIGEYTATARFNIAANEINNYNPLSVTELTATLKIKMGEFDMSNIKFENTSYSYDGTEKVLTIKGMLPEGVTVAYENNKRTTVGSTTAIAKFTIDESVKDKYNAIPDMTATLTITLGTIEISEIKFENAEYVYDGKEHILEITGELPSLVTVSYENNKRTLVGTNQATAIFTIDESERSNYNPIPSKIANLTITKIPTTITITDISNLNRTYNGEAVQNPEYTITRSSDIAVDKETVRFEYYEGNTATGNALSEPPVNSGTYTVKAILEESDYFAEATDTATFAITKVVSTIDIINIAELNREYNKVAVEAKYQASRDGKITVEYTNDTTGIVSIEAPVNAGTYTVKAVLAEELNYTGAVATKKFEIQKATVDMSGVEFKDVSYSYNAQPYTITITGELPEGVSVEYENNVGTNVGKYYATANFYITEESERDNYNKIESKTAILEILATSGTIEITNKDKFSKIYDGQEVVQPEIETTRTDTEPRIEYYLGAKAEGTPLDYIPVNAGTYTVKVVIDAFEGYLEISDQETFTIQKAPSTIEITNKEELNRTYNGEAIEVKYEATRGGNITDKNITVEYTNNITGEKSAEAPMNAGTYTVKVSLSEEENYLGDTDQTVFTITKVPATIKITNKEELNRTYNGEAVEVKYEATRDGLIIDQNITVTYTDNTTGEQLEEAPINAGEYLVKVSLPEEENYSGATAEEVFIIEKAPSTIEITNKEELNRTYNGEKVDVTYEAKREGSITNENINVEYTNNVTGEQLEEAPINAGEYLVKVSLPEEENYAGATAEEIFTISKATKDMSNVKFEDVTFDYDGEEHTITITGDLPKDVTVSYENNTQTDVGTYEAIAKFTITDEIEKENYNEIPNITATLKIVPVTGKITILNKESLDKQYDGIEFADPMCEQSRPGAINFEYYVGNNTEGEKLESNPVDAGTYTVKAILQAFEGYLETFDQATFTITKAPSTIVITNKDALNREYNGEKVDVICEAKRDGNITDEDIIIEYTNNKTQETTSEAPINAGTYTVKVRLKEETNYAGATDETTFTIRKVPSTIKITNAEKLNRIYNGEAVEVEYTASRTELPNVIYTNSDNEVLQNAPVNVGTYKVKVVLEETENYEGATDEIEFKITKVPSTIKIKNIDALNRVYDGNAVEVECDKSRDGDVTVEYTNTVTNETSAVAPINAGSYKVKVILEETENYEGATDEATFTIRKVPATIVITNKDKLKRTYNGEAVEVEYEATRGGSITTENIIIEYTNDADGEILPEAPKFVGTYLVKVILPEDENHEGATEEFKFTIDKATKDMSKVKFESAIFDYDGKEHTITITGELPEGVNVEYENNKGTDVGTYEAIAKFTIIDETERANYNEIPNKTATLEIVPVAGTIEITNIDELNRTYNGEAVEVKYEAKRGGNIIVEDIIVEYTNNVTGEILNETPINAGEYKVKVILEAFGGYLGASDEKTFTISKALSEIKITNKEELNRTYNGEAVEVTYETKRGDNFTDEDIIVEYTNNKTQETTTETPINAGTYKVKVILEETENYESATDETTFTITKLPSTIEITNEESLNRIYNGEAVDVKYEAKRNDSITNENITVEYTNTVTNETSVEAPINAGTYKVKVILEETENYEGATDEATFTIAKVPASIKITNGDALNRIYNGNAIEVEYDSTRDENIIIEYINTETDETLEETPRFVGTYLVRVSLPEDENHEGASDELEFTISKATKDMSKVIFENATFDYDGEEHTITITGELPEGVNVEYENNSGTEVGTYEAIAKFTIIDEIERANYNEIPNMTATLEIVPVVGTIEITNIDELNRTYNGEAVEVKYEAKRGGEVIVENIIVEYTNNVTGELLNEAPINAGEYKVKVILEAFGGYLGASDEKEFTIEKASSTIEITNKEDLNRTYNGEKVEATYEATRDGNPTDENIIVEYINTETDETLEEAPINAGTYKVKVTIPENENYKEAVAEETFVISKEASSIEITNKEELNRIYNGEKVEVKYEARRGDNPTDENITVEYTNAEGELLEGAPVNAGEYLVKVNLAENENYKSATDEFEFIIEKATKDMSNVIFEDTTFYYDEYPHSVEITGDLPEGVSVEYENNTQTDVGIYEAIAKFIIIDENERANYNEIPNMTATLEIVAITGKITIIDKEGLNKTYDGIEIQNPICDQTRPGNIRFEYYKGENTEGEKLFWNPVDAGTYTLKAILPKYKGYLETFDLATFTIFKAPSEIKITNKEELVRTYNGEKVEVEYEATRDGKITDENIIVEYTNCVTNETSVDAPVNAGTYKVKVSLSEEQNYEGATAEEIFTIEKASSTIEITNKEEFSRTYNGEKVEATYEAKRDGNITDEKVIVEYTKAEGEILEEAPINAGTYKVKVTIPENENYKEATDEVEFTIDKATKDMSKVKFESAQFDYNGEEHTITITGELPEGVEVRYESNTARDVGTYEAIAKFTIVDETERANYNEIPNMTAVLEIIPVTGIVEIRNKDDFNKVYDGKEVVNPEIYTTRLDTEPREEYYLGTEATGTPLDYRPVNAGTYTLKVVVDASEGYVEISDKVTFTIEKAETVIRITNEENLNRTYNGTKVDVTYEAIRDVSISEEDFIVEYTKFEGEALEETPVNAGKYTVKVTIKESDNYKEASVIVNFEITKAKSTIEITNTHALNRVYNGQSVEVTYEARRGENITDENIIVEYTNVEGEALEEAPINAGSYKVKVILEENENYESATAEEIFTIEKATYDMSNVTFEDITYPYDGEEKEIVIIGELPAGVTVSYENNTGTDAGEYLAIAKFEVADLVNYNEVPNMEAKLIITKIPGKITITNKEELNKTYDGLPAIEPICETVGEGEIITEYYIGEIAEGESFENSPINAGTYTVKVILPESNNYEVASDTATFEISKATYDMSGITFEDATYTYDGELKVIEITGELPEGVEVSYENNTGTDAGEYLAIAKFEVDTVNYNTIENMTAKLTIEKAESSITITNTESLNKVYDGLPAIAPICETVGEVEPIIEYYIGETAEGESFEESPINAGIYTVKAILPESKNYLSSEDKTTFEISKATYDMSEITFEDATYTYDGEQKEIVITGELPEGITVNYENNTGIDAGEYLAIAKFEVDTVNYNTIENMTAKLTIEKAESSITITNKEELNKIYDGLPVIEPICETVGEVEPVIEYYIGETAEGESFAESPVNVGKYTVKVILPESKNYIDSYDTATFEISKATYDMSEITFEDVTYPYDGEEKEIVITGELPAGVTVSYENNKGTDVGEYLAIAKFEVADLVNYNEIPNMEATLKITQISGNIIITNKEELNKIYDGLPAIEPICETIGEGEIITEYYIGEIAEGESFENSPINAGTYTVKVILPESKNYEVASDTATFEISKATYNMSEITFEDATYTYDGEQKELVLTGELPAGVEVNYENNTGTDAGEYLAIAKFEVADLVNYNTIENMTAKLTIEKAASSITITNTESLNKVYDGLPAIAPICETVGEVEPIIEYYIGETAEGESFGESPVNAGKYTIKAILPESNNYVGSEAETRFEISKATYDMSGIKFEDVIHVYDGTKKEIVITGELPAGVEVSYENNTGIEIGEYIAIAKFTVLDENNYNSIEDMTAILKIQKEFVGVVITNKNDLSKVYDGKIVTAPTYLAPKDTVIRIEYYSGTEAKGDVLERVPINAGVYTVKVISEENENSKESFDTATFEIFKATYDMSNIEFEDASYVYDGTEKSILVTGNLPTGVWITYHNNVQTDVGEYESVVKFKVDERNYHTIPDMVATLTITQAIGSITITNDSELSKIYDGKTVVEPIYEKTGEGAVKVEYFEGNIPLGAPLSETPINVGIYTVRVTLEETNNYTSAIDEAIFEITKAKYDMSNVKFEDATFEYDGTEKEIIVTGELPEGVTVEYERNKATEVGEYYAIARFIGDEMNYEPIEEMQAVLRIEKPNIQIDFKDYEIIEKDGIEYIILEEETSAEEFKNNISPSPEEILNDGEKIADDENISTGMDVIFNMGDDTKTYKTILKGDIYRDGYVDEKDLLMLARYIVEYENAIAYVNELSLIASDVHEDNLYAQHSDLLALAIMLTK